MGWMGEHRHRVEIVHHAVDVDQGGGAQEQKEWMGEVLRPLAKIRRSKLIDRYTKTTLTIIGLALLALAAQNGLQRAGAQWNCGSSPDNPCYLRVHLDCGGSTCPVRVER
jgi:hypothetical protein